jgi:hypothetical protein
MLIPQPSDDPNDPLNVRSLDLKVINDSGTGERNIVSCL